MLNEKEKTRWQKIAVIKIQRKWILKHKDFSYTMEDSGKSSLSQWTASNEGKKIPRSLCIFEMTYGCEILRQRMRQSNFSMPTWKTLNWTDLQQWHLVNVLSKKLLVQFHLRSSIMHDWSPVWGEFWCMARIIFLNMSIYWQNAHVSEHDAINSMSKGLKLLTSVELQHRVKFKGNWIFHLMISIWNSTKTGFKTKAGGGTAPRSAVKKVLTTMPSISETSS